MSNNFFDNFFGGAAQGRHMLVNRDPQAVGFLHAHVGGQKAQHRQAGRFAFQEGRFFGIADLVAHQVQAFQAYIGGQFFDLGVGLQAAAVGFLH